MIKIGKPKLPKIKIRAPKIPKKLPELPKVELPKVELPKVELPKELPHFPTELDWPELPKILPGPIGTIPIPGEKEAIDRLSELVTGKTIEENIEHIAGELKNAPESLRICFGNLEKCKNKAAARLIYLLCWRIIKEYKAHLFREANGKWENIPSNFVKAVSKHYPEIDVGSVQYATGVNTIHGDTITWEDRIFTPKKSIDLSITEDASLMLHELKHTVQYKKRGGDQAFLGEYILKAAGKIIEKRSINIHDDIDIEWAAMNEEKTLVPLFCYETPRGLFRRWIWELFLCTQPLY